MLEILLNYIMMMLMFDFSTDWVGSINFLQKSGSYQSNESKSDRSKIQIEVPLWRASNCILYLQGLGLCTTWYKFHVLLFSTFQDSFQFSRLQYGTSIPISELQLQVQFYIYTQFHIYTRKGDLAVTFLLHAFRQQLLQNLGSTDCILISFF